MGNGQIESFMRQLVDAQEELHCAIASMMPFDRSDVQDVLQETNYALISHASGFNPEKHFLPFAIAFAKNQVLAYFKRKKRENGTIVFDSELVKKCMEAALDPRGAAAGHSEKALEICREKLNPRQKRLISMRYDANTPVREMAEQLHTEAATVSKALLRIRQRLGDCIRRLCRMDAEADGEDFTPLSPFESSLASLLDGENVPPHDAFVQSLSASEENFSFYLTQIRVDLLLSRVHQPRAALPLPLLSWWKRALSEKSWMAVAAALAVLLAGGAFLARRGGTSQEADRPLPVPAVTAKLPAPEFVEKRTELPQASPVAAKQPGPQSLAAQRVKIFCVTNQQPAAARPQRKEEKMNAAVAKLNTLAATATVAAAVAAYVSPQAALATDDVPVVSNVTFKQPFNSRVLEIGYTLANGPGIVTVDITTNGVSIGDENLTYFSGAVNKLVSNGTYTVQWDTKYAWPGHTNLQARAVVTAWITNYPPDYMVVNILNGAVRYYTSAAALPNGGITNELYKTDRIAMRKIHAAGVPWDMGSKSETGMDESRETSQPVTLLDDYYIGVYEITQGQWHRITGSISQVYFKAFFDQYPSRPVEQVSYCDIREYTNNTEHTEYQYPNAPGANSYLGLLRSRTGVAFDLPSEAQWEYACRAGTTEGHWNDGSKILGQNDANLNKLGRYLYNGGAYSVSNPDTITPTGGTAVVGTYLPNLWGLYDMHGNVWEWCLDWYVPKYVYPNGDGAVNTTKPSSSASRVMRGGGWDRDAFRTRSASRDYVTPATRTASIYFGFRVAAPAIAPEEY